MTERIIPSCPNCGETEMTSRGPKCGCTAGEMASSLYQEPQKDGFKSESPIRAFTDWTVTETFAIGKGFRPSLAHLTTYLDAMLMKEGWRLVQILEAATGHPSMVFTKDDGVRYSSMTVYHIPPAEELNYQGLTAAEQAALGEGRLSRALGEPYTPGPISEVMAVYVDGKEVTSKWTDRGSDIPIPDKHYVACAAYVLEKLCNPKYLATTVREFKECFGPPKNHQNISHRSLAEQLQFIHDRTPIVKIKQLIDSFRVLMGSGKSWRVPEELHDILVSPATDDETTIAKLTPDGIVEQPLEIDPINPKHYAGRDCADIGERLSANGYQILKYCWRLGKKDDPCQELGKAVWYAESEKGMLPHLMQAQKSQLVLPNVWGLPGDDNGMSWFVERIADQPQFTRNIASMLWTGYNERRLQAIIEAINEHKFHLDCGRGLAV